MNLLILAPKKKGRDPEYRCSICGRYISYSEIDDGKITIKDTPDSEFTVEQTEMFHNNCEVIDKIYENPELLNAA